jgi:hypothetical protein
LAAIRVERARRANPEWQQRLVGPIRAVTLAVMEIIKKKLTLEYWPVNDWFEGRLREIPEVLSQGRNTEELEQNVREDCADLVRDVEYARRRGYGHLDEADIWNADLEMVKLDRQGAAVAQLQSLSPERQEKIYSHIEDLVDLEAFERRADVEDGRHEDEEGGTADEW